MSPSGRTSLRDGQLTLIDPDPRRIFDGLLDEHDYVIDDTEGTLPEGLRGTLYRNGPGNWEVGGQPLSHVFDGDGMLSMFRIDGTTVRYRNRYVRTQHFGKGRASSGVPLRGIGTLKPGGPLANALRLPANVANTNVVMHAGKLLALWELGNPHALNPDTLDTIGTHNFDGALTWLGAFSAHPKIDPATGDLYNFGFEIVPRPMLRCYRVDTSGRLHKLHDVPLPEPVFNHDFALTERHMVFVIDPISVSLRDLPGAALGFTSLDKALRFKASRGTTIVLVPRDGGRPITMQTDALMHFHVNNAYEDGGDTVVDVVEWSQPWDAINVALRDFRTAPQDKPLFGGMLLRLRVNGRNRTVTREPLSDARGEFPQFDWRRAARSHRYSYLAAASPGSAGPDTVVKVDHDTGRERTHQLPTSNFVSEPIFVPRARDAAEDDGWLLAVAYDPAVHRSRLLVLDARHPQRSPLFTGHLRHHVPQGFHGTFTRRVGASQP